nr:helix-turn-helix domain-containing protein [Streptomyces hygroscopicus]
MDDPRTAPHAGGVLAIDGSGDRKDGIATANVGRQWLGRYGKTDLRVLGSPCLVRSRVTAEQADHHEPGAEQLRRSPAVAVVVPFGMLEKMRWRVLMTLVTDDLPSVDRLDKLGRLCGVLTDRIDEISEMLTERIRTEIPSYAQMPREEHDRTVRATAQTLLSSLAAGEEPAADQLREIQLASRRRSYYGLPVYDVLAAFHVVARELWEQLRQAHDGDEGALIELVGPIWLWIQAMSSVVVDAYIEEAGARHSYEAGLRQRLFELLRGGGATDEQVREIARELGFDPSGRFQALCAPAGAWSQGQLDPLHRAARQLGGTVQCGLHGAVLIVLAQNVPTAKVVSRVSQLGGSGVLLGVGLLREGLVGAEMSIGDAERALRLAPGGGSGVIRFEDVWLQASLTGAEQRLEPLFTRARQVARENPILVDAVRAFSRCGFTLSGAATELGVHPNTVGYRLARWQDLTGLDPRTLPGLLRSVLADLTDPG